jgi:Replication-relaxation
MALTKTPVLTHRDYAFLSGLLDYGILSFEQVQTAFFPESEKTAGDRQNRRYGVTSTVLHRLYALEKAGYIVLSTHEETARLPNTRVVWLSKKGAQEEARDLKIDIKNLHWQKPHSRLTQLSHDLFCNTFRIRLEAALPHQRECSLKEWVSGRLLAGDSDTIEYAVPFDGKMITKKRKIIADSFCILTVGETTARYPIEIDNSTLTQTRILKEKIYAGLSYINSPEYKKRYGENRGRWLFVMESERRMKNLQETVLRELGKVKAIAFYFTTFEQIKTKNVLTDPIWFLGGASQTPQSLLYAVEHRV